MDSSVDSEKRFRSRWFTFGVASSLSLATFATPTAFQGDDPSLLVSTLRASESRPWIVSNRFDSSLGENPQQRFEQSAWVQRLPWTGAWWWTQSGSIATRWRSELYWNADGTKKLWKTHRESNSLTYPLHSAEELREKGSSWIRDTLSPSEKLDVVAGKADPSRSDYYANTRSIRKFVSTVIQKYPEQLGYHGLCHGYSAASIELPEPQSVVIPVDYLDSRGQKFTLHVGFGSGDLKALATYHYADRIWDEEIALETDEKNGIVRENALYAGVGGRGVNAGAFHLLLTNFVLKNKESFIVDTGEGKEVWNYPVAGFSTRSLGVSRLTSSEYDPRAVREVLMASEVYYMGTSNPSQDPFGSERTRARVFTHAYRYRLALDSEGNVVDGRWEMGSRRPDFVWRMRGALKMKGDYAIIRKYWAASSAE